MIDEHQIKWDDDAPLTEAEMDEIRRNKALQKQAKIMRVMGGICLAITMFAVAHALLKKDQAQATALVVAVAAGMLISTRARPRYA